MPESLIECNLCKRLFYISLVDNLIRTMAKFDPGSVNFNVEAKVCSKLFQTVPFMLVLSCALK